MSIILDMIFWARFIYIKTQFYKTEGIAYGNSNHYFSEFLIRDDKGYNYVGWVSRNIFSPLHTRGEVYTIYVSKINSKNAVMGNEPTLYLIPSIVFFVFVITIPNKFPCRIVPHMLCKQPLYQAHTLRGIL